MTSGSNLEFNDLYFTRFYLFLQFFDATKGLSNRIVSTEMHSLLLLPLKTFFVWRRQLRNYLLLIFLIVRKLVFESSPSKASIGYHRFANTFQSRKEFLYESNKCFYCLSNDILHYLFYIPQQHSYYLRNDMKTKHLFVQRKNPYFDLIDIFFSILTIHIIFFTLLFHNCF